jgi:competence protein ComEA
MDIIAFLNSSDASELEAHLSGVGKVTAQKIVEFRSENGSFSSLEDFAKVSGVGDATIKKIEAGTFKQALPDSVSAGTVSAPSTPPRAPKAAVPAAGSPAGVDSFPESPTTPSKPVAFGYTAETLTQAQAEQVSIRERILEDWKINKETTIHKWRQDPIKLKGKDVVLQPPLDKMYNDILQEYDRRFMSLMQHEQDDFDTMLREAQETNTACVKKHGDRKKQHQSAAQTLNPKQSAVEAFADLMAGAAQVNDVLIEAGKKITEKLSGDYQAEFKCRPSHCPLKSTGTILEKVVFKYCQDVKSTGVEGADFQKNFKKGLNDCKDIAGVTIVLDSFAGLIQALHYCNDPEVNGGMEVVSIKNSFLYGDGDEECFRKDEGYNPGDKLQNGEPMFKNPFVCLSDGRYFTLYEKEDGGNGRAKKTDPEYRDREIVLPYNGPGEWVYYNPDIVDKVTSHGGTGKMGAYKTMAKNQSFFDGSQAMVGWRDLLLNVKFPHINDHICELQLHHRDFTHVREKGVGQESSIMQEDEYQQCYESIPANMEKGHTVYTAYREHFGRGLVSM